MRTKDWHLPAHPFSPTQTPKPWDHRYSLTDVLNPSIRIRHCGMQSHCHKQLFKLNIDLGAESTEERERETSWQRYAHTRYRENERFRFGIDQCSTTNKIPSSLWNFNLTPICSPVHAICNRSTNGECHHVSLINIYWLRNRHGHHFRANRERMTESKNWFMHLRCTAPWTRRLWTPLKAKVSLSTPFTDYPVRIALWAILGMLSQVASFNGVETGRIVEHRNPNTFHSVEFGLL